MKKSVFKISKMDCPSEENLIRMKLADLTTVKKLDFDLTQRKLTIFHVNDVAPIQQIIGSLNLGDHLLKTEEATSFTTNNNDMQQRRLLWTVLIINFAFFVIEATTGWLAQSLGLIADSLDMLADAVVYGLSLIAVGGTVAKKKRIATTAGYFQMLLATVGFVEVLRRFFGYAPVPNFTTMLTVAFLALLANALCLFLLQRSHDREAHMQASMIFTSNDIIINTGVMLAGGLVYYFNSNLPDLIIGFIVFVIVMRGAFRILTLGK